MTPTNPDAPEAKPPFIPAPHGLSFAEAVSGRSFGPRPTTATGTDTPTAAERAKFLNAYGAPDDWLIFTSAEIKELKREADRLRKLHAQELEIACTQLAAANADRNALRGQVEEACRERLSFMRIGAEKANECLSLTTQNEVLDSKNAGYRVAIENLRTQLAAANASLEEARKERDEYRAASTEDQPTGKGGEL